MIRWRICFEWLEGGDGAAGVEFADYHSQEARDARTNPSRRPPELRGVTLERLSRRRAEDGAEEAWRARPSGSRRGVIHTRHDVWRPGSHLYRFLMMATGT